MVNTRPFATVTDEKPIPTCAFHSCFGPSAGHEVVQPVSFEMPLASGPRHRGQSLADARTGNSRTKIPGSFIMSLHGQREFNFFAVALDRERYFVTLEFVLQQEAEQFAFGHWARFVVDAHDHVVLFEARAFAFCVFAVLANIVDA